MSAKLNQNFRSYITWDVPLSNGDSEMPPQQSSNSGQLSTAGQEDKPPRLSPAVVQQLVQQQHAQLLPGETLVASCSHVLLWHQLDRQLPPAAGQLIVTNFKLTFEPTAACLTDAAKQPAPRLDLGASDWCRLLSANQLCLANIDRLLHVMPAGGGRRLRRSTKLLTPHSHVPAGKIKTLQIRCKDFRVLNVSFEQTPACQVRDVVNALLMYTYPRLQHLLFAFDYRQPDNVVVASAAAGGCNDAVQCDFDEPSHWTHELHRCNATGWRVSHVNQRFHMSQTLPETVVVPQCLSDAQVLRMSAGYIDNRPPLWCCSCVGGAALLRCSATLPALRDSDGERVYLEAIGRSHPAGREPLVLDVSTRCVCVHDIYVSYCRLRQLCVPESREEMVEGEGRWLSLLSDTRWPHAVVQLLALASHCVQVLTQQHTSVVLSETTGRDVSAAVSSLVQLLIDKHCRTLVGFQRLIDKEWLALAHPFQSRHALVQHAHGPNERSAVFLLFLDCVHQLVEQFPGDFQLSPVFLVAVWDSCLVPATDTFLFDSAKQRANAVCAQDYSLQRRSVWRWCEWLRRPDDQQLFVSPLYQLCHDSAFSQLFNDDQYGGAGRSGRFDAPAHAAPTAGRRTAAPTGYSLLAQLVRAGPPQPPPPPPLPMRQSVESGHSVRPRRQQRKQRRRWPSGEPLHPHVSLASFRLWTLCFCRWLPELNTPAGGAAAATARLRQLMAQLVRLTAQRDAVQAGVAVRHGRPRRRRADGNSAASGEISAVSGENSAVSGDVDGDDEAAALPCAFSPFSTAVGGGRLLCAVPSTGLVNTLVRHSIAAPAGGGSTDKLADLRH